MTRRFAMALGFLAVILSPTTPPAKAGLIYVEGSNSVLGTLDPTTGAVQVVGATGVRLSGLGFGPDGTLYGYGDDLNIYRVNTTTAALTFVGGVGSITTSGGSAMGATSDGTLYLDAGGLVYTVNPTNAALTTLGNLGFKTGSDLNGDASGNLYIVKDDSLYAVSRTTGAGTLIGNGSYGAIYGLAFVDGTMYAMETFGNTGVYALDLTNGQSTLVSHYDASPLGGEIYTAAALLTAVPEPSGLAMIGIGSIVVLIRGRRRIRARLP